DAQHLFDAEERAFVEALAAQAAQALDRSVLYEAERVARASAEELADRLERFQRVTGELAAAATVEDIAEVVVTHAAQALDSPLASVSLVVADDTLRLVRVTGARAGVAKRWETYPISAALPASEAVRNNAPVIVYTRQELRDRFPSVAGDVEDERSLVCVPLSIGDLRLGVISLSFEPSRDVADPAHLRFLTTLADACAQALQRANALAEARVAGDKLSFLAEASAELARSLDYRVTLGNVARLIVPRLADWCSIQIIDGGQLVTVAVAHTDPAMVELASELQERYPVDPNAPTGAPNVIRTGEPELYPDITDEMIVAGAIDEEHLRVIRELGLSSVLTVPLTGATGTFGAISLVATDSGRHYDEDDVAFASDLARRAAVAVENAEAFQRQTGRLAAITRIAEAAQHAILPPVPRRVGCIDIEAAYTSAAREALVGGDLYEVVSVDGGVRLIIGDVRGKGLDAVRMATVVLGEFRAAAVDRDNIAAVARQMDQRLRSYLGDEDFVTALIAQIGDDGTCEVVCCGHPPALVAAHGGYRYIGNADSLPLGLGADPQPASTVLEPGDRLLLYTDGLLEARGADGKFIELDEVAAPLTDGPLDSVLERIQASLKGLVGGSLADDLALLVAEYRPA
ncbi:MAG: hypothetical protein QOH80_459, partial [Actinomycetota bacterium]|nr:hypothetical protein [Actinomycetota bacterium]